MKSDYFFLRGTVEGSKVELAFVDMKSCVTWCSNHKQKDAKFEIECKGRKIATISYKKPFHVIESFA